MRHRILYLTILAVSAAVSCDRYSSDGYKFDNSIYMDVSATKQAQATTFGNNVPEVTKSVIATLAYPADHDVTATVAYDASLAAEYNDRYNTDYDLLPSQYTSFTSATVSISAGRTTSEAVDIVFTGLMGEGDEQTGAMEVDHTYLFPVRITSDDIDVMKASSVAYYLVRRSSAITVAADLTDNWINFPLLDVAGTQADAYNGLTAITYEALIYISKFDLTNDFGSCNISTVMGVEQYFLLRIGDTNFERQQLQLDGTGSGTSFDKFPDSDAAKKLYAGQWYHVACTYDYDTRVACIYVNGELQSEGSEMGTATGGINLAQRALGSAEAYQFFVGKSYNDYRPLQGMIAEARVWSVARTAEEIWNNMYRIENPETLPELIGYWKFDDGEGNTVKDWSMYHNDGTAENDLVWANAIEIPEINKEEE